MRRHPSARPFFRPRLERLETRDLLSAAGFVLPNLMQPLPQLAQQMTADVQKMNVDFNQLQADVIANGPLSTNPLTAPPTNDYAKLGNDWGQIKALGTIINTAAKIDQALLFLGMADGTFDASDGPPISMSLNIIKSATNTANSDLAQANALANTDPGNGFPTVASSLQP